MHGEVLDFWFAAENQPRWFVRDPAFDASVVERLGHLHERAAAGELESWGDDPRGALALVILLDQVPRNAFRGQARAFASDPHARAITSRALDLGLDRALTEVERVFLYLPLEHSESLADQERCCALMAALSAPIWLDFAERHRAIIARFGRFPHRNVALGRASTAEEIAFLAEPGSSF